MATVSFPKLHYLWYVARGNVVLLELTMLEGNKNGKLYQEKTKE